MSLPMMDFMPDDLRRVVHVQRSKRRIALLGILLLVFSVGVSAHSWNSARIAERDRADGATRVANTPGVDELMDRMAQEQAELERALRVSDGLIPPVSASNVVATLTHLIPEHVTLSGIRLETEESPRQILVVIKGFAATNSDLAEFERALAGASAFQSVTVSESKASSFMDKRVEEFTVSFQVPMEAKVRTNNAMRVALGGGS